MTCSGDWRRSDIGGSSRPTRPSTASRSTAERATSWSADTHSIAPCPSTTRAPNLDRQRLRDLTGAVQPAATRPALSLHDWPVGWISEEADPRQELDSLPGVMHHLSDAWARRRSPNVVLVRYDDLSADLDGAMRRLAAHLGTVVPDATWPGLVEAASFRSMRERASELAPDPSGILLDRAAFFRRGTPGAGRDVLTDAEMDSYQRRVSRLAAPDLLTWLHATASARPDLHGRGIVDP